jgi:hypothetical protein
MMLDGELLTGGYTRWNSGSSRERCHVQEMCGAVALDVSLETAL